MPLTLHQIPVAEAVAHFRAWCELVNAGKFFAAFDHQRWLAEAGIPIGWQPGRGRVARDAAARDDAAARKKEPAGPLTSPPARKSPI